ncbi:MAG: hypothetical protein U9N35_00500 [Euryarchaeota archaeon]|nr:hypothetical protein [Euryarchaeota archaeon]
MNKILKCCSILCIFLILGCIGTEEKIRETVIIEEEGTNSGTFILPTENGFIIFGANFLKKEIEPNLLKIDKDYNIRWSKNHIVEEEHYVPRDFLETGDGYLLSGCVQSLAEKSSKIMVLETDKEGNEYWRRSYTGLGYSMHGSVLSADNGFLIVGLTYASPGSKTSTLLVKTDRKGNKEWQKVYGEKQTGAAICKAENGYLIAGMSRANDDGDLLLIKVTESGEEIWSKTYRKVAVEWPCSVFSFDDGFVVAGYSSRHGGDFLLMKVDKEGNELWSKRYDNEDEVPGDAIKTEDGFVIVGNTFSDIQAEKDIFIIKVDKEGNEQWRKIYGDEKNQVANSLCRVSGSIFVVGTTATKDEGDVLLIKIE